MRRPIATLLPVAVGLVVGAGTFVALSGVVGDDDERPRADTAIRAADTIEQGRAIFARMGCGSCHRLAAAGSSGTIGPNLDERLAGYTAGSLAERIVRRGSGGNFTAMPDDFGDRMSDAELETLVRFLLAVRKRS